MFAFVSKPEVKKSAREVQVQRRRPSLERLESRDLMACGIHLFGSTLTIDGAGFNDAAEVKPLGAVIQITLDCGNNGVGVDHVAVFGPGALTKVIFKGYGGDDYFFNDTAIPSIAYGGDGNDDLHGGSGADKLYGEAGNDCLCGGAGDDWMYGGTGNDLMHGWGGNDQMWGGAGDDLLSGDQGDDVLRGEAGNDRLHGFAGMDALDGGLGFDQLFGGLGVDVLIAGEVLSQDGDGPPVPNC